MECLANLIRFTAIGEEKFVEGYYLKQTPIGSIFHRHRFTYSLMYFQNPHVFMHMSRCSNTVNHISTR